VTARGGAAIVATHNLSRAYAMADRFVLMRDGAVAWRVERQGLHADQLRELYARHAETEETAEHIAASGAGAPSW
jgi:ABC-type sugar transport system ATPase subunit